MTTKHTNLSRRSILGGSVAALAASPALASAAILQGDDSALIAMGEDWRRAWAHLQDMQDQQSEAEERYSAIAPEFPAVLTKTERDWELGLCARPHHAGSLAFQSEFIEQFRTTPRHPHQKLREEAQARANEVVAAWDQYRADIEDARQQSGLAIAESAELEAVAALHGIEDRIARTPATTLRGMLVKARVAWVDPVHPASIEALEEALEERIDAGRFMGLSLILDVLDMSGGDA